MQAIRAAPRRAITTPSEPPATDRRLWRGYGLDRITEIGSAIEEGPTLRMQTPSGQNRELEEFLDAVRIAHD